jgi:hypothetical protein
MTSTIRYSLTTIIATFGLTTWWGAFLIDLAAKVN